MVLKKLFLLLILCTFLIGAAGGCFNFSTPDLSGNWHGTLESAKNPLVSIEVDITGLSQDPIGNFTGGDVEVTYSYQYNAITVSYTLVAPVTSGDTDEWRARIKAQKEISPEETASLTALIFVLTGNTVTLSEGDSYELVFTFPHEYGCRGGGLNELVGPYEFKIYKINTSDAPLGQVFDTGTAEIERTSI